MRVFILPWLLAASSLAGCAGQAVCEKAKECADDPPGEDYVQVCAARHKASLDALRANREEECHELAAAQERLDACRAQLECDDFTEGDLGGECDQEIDDYEDAFDDAAGGDFGGTAIGPAGPGPNFALGIPEDCSSWD